MSDAPQTTDAVPKKGKKRLFLIIALVLLLVAGGGGGYFYFINASSAKKAEKSRRTRAAKQEETVEQPEGKNRSKAQNVVDLNLPDDSEVSHVIELQPFIVNLADKGEARYLRMTVSIGLGGEVSEKEKPNPLFTTRVRNAMLAVLTTKTSDEILTPEGKAALRKELLRAARAAVEEPEIKAIYITDFIVQL